jgi:hypothetical protein
MLSECWYKVLNASKSGPSDRLMPNGSSVPIANSARPQTRAAVTAVPILLQRGQSYAVGVISCEHKDGSEQQGSQNCANQAVSERYEIGDERRNERES